MTLPATPARYGPHDPDTVPQLVTIRTRTGEQQVAADPAIARQRAALNNLAAGLATTPSKPQTVGTSDEWALFVSALRQVADAEGVISQTRMRPLIRSIFHKHRGPMYTRARREGLIEPLHREPSTDLHGKNGDKDQRVYRLIA